MPRDLPGTEERTLTASPETQTPRPASTTDEYDSQPGSNGFMIIRDESEDRELQLSNKLRKGDEKRNLHPYVQILSLSDLDAVVALENATFPEKERCSKEKFIYRLTTCPSLTLGLFSSTSTPPTPQTQPAHDAARAPDSRNPSHRSLLLAMVIGTMTTSPTVTDASMHVPLSWPSQAPSKPVPATSTDGEPQPDHCEPPRVPAKDGAGEGETVGHAEHGQTIAVHSVCVLPTHQHLGLGKTVLKAYIQRMETSGIADRIALLSHPELVEWYTGSFGFQDKGESTVQFGGGGWRNLVYGIVDHGPGA